MKVHRSGTRASDISGVIALDKFRNGAERAKSKAKFRTRGRRDRSSTWGWCRNARISSCSIALVRNDARKVKRSETKTDSIAEKAYLGMPITSTLATKNRIFSRHSEARVQRRDRLGSVVHEYALAARSGL